MKVALGFRTHLGWTAAIAVGRPRNAPKVIDRRRIVLSSEVPESHEPYHKAAEVRDDLKQARAIVKRGERAIHAVAKKGVRDWVADLESDGHEVAAAGLLMAGTHEMSFESMINAHAHVHTAEGRLMREAVRAGCEAIDIPVLGVREKVLLAEATAKLGYPEVELMELLKEWGKDLGSPWRQDQKYAALVAWLAL